MSARPAAPIPEAFAAVTIRREGELGRQWIEALPQQVAELCARWSLVLDGPPRHGGLSLVYPASRLGDPCALKLTWLDPVQEVAALQTWDGQGAVQLFGVDADLRALLLERLDPARTLESVELPTARRVAGELLQRLAVPAPPTVPTLRAWAERFVTGLPRRWAQAGRSVPSAVVERACELARDLGPTAGDRLVNRDLHYGNVLAGKRESWLVIDPMVVAGSLEFGLGPLLWRRLEETEAAGGVGPALDELALAAGLDPDLARGWTLLRCVDYWLWGLGAGLTEDPQRCRRVIEALW